jgi:hypothetical protein
MKTNLLALALLAACTVESGAPDAGPDAQADAGPCSGSCPSGYRCADDLCVPATLNGICASDHECPSDQRCSVYRRCFSGDCLGLADCPAEARCFNDRCVPRIAPEHGVMFERRDPRGIEPRVAQRPFPATLGYGFGGGLFDIDGDRDLDLFLGTTYRLEAGGSPPCIYRNESIPGRLQFTAIPEFCQHQERAITSAYGVDLEADGFDELVLLGRGIVRLQRFHPSPAQTDLLALLPAGDQRHSCNAGAVAPIDIDLDGRLDLVIGCQEEGTRNDELYLRNIVVIQTDGGFELLGRDPLTPPDQTDFAEDDGSSLAFAVYDADDDGLLDLVVANDTFSTMGHGNAQRELNLDLTSGATYARCLPDENCLFSRTPLLEGVTGWGSFMGFGLVGIEGQGEWLYVSDYGPNRLIQRRENGPVDHANRYGLQLPSRSGELLYAWSAIVEDLDRDGRDDLLISHGAVSRFGGVQVFAAHRDVALIQQPGGQFLEFGGEVGLAPFTEADAHTDEHVYSARGWVKADLDGDGFLDLVQTGLEGVPRFQAEVPTLGAAPPRCTLVPINRYVASYAAGFAVAGAPAGPFARRDLQGQMRMGTSPFVLTTVGAGHLRFPSGAIVPFDCAGTAGPIEVTEPDWIGIQRSGDAVQILLDPPSGRTIEALTGWVDIGGATTAFVGRLDGPHFSVEMPPGAQRLMLTADGRTIGRWFNLPEAR